MSAGNAPPIIVWFRRDLRLADNPALSAAAGDGRPVIPLYVFDETPGIRPVGGASRWWLERSVQALANALEGLGSRLVIRRGKAADVLKALVEETGAEAVFWNRLYDRVDRDKDLKAALPGARTFNASLLNEPWEVKTGAGGPYSVFTPYWRSARSQVGKVEVTSAPKRLAEPDKWPDSETLNPFAPKWAGGFDIWTPGEAGATQRLTDFLDRLDGYGDDRDRPDLDITSHLSPHLHFGEIGPRQVWLAAHAAEARRDSDRDKFLSELGWREFNHHVLFHNPKLAAENLKGGFEGMPWRDDPEGLEAWKRGRTGYPLVDAGMRELWATGFMHNRVRMVAASFLIKHLMIDWRIGEQWFWDTLVDADPANNPANWQWVAGCGADASPWFRIFNPTKQAETFDPDDVYVRRWVPEYGSSAYPEPIVDHAKARARALDALKGL